MQEALWRLRFGPPVMLECVVVDLLDLCNADTVVLGQNAPNPFTPVTSFTYMIPRPGRVEILIYNVAGRIIQDVQRVHATAGTFEFPWDACGPDGTPAATGAYFCSVRVDGKTETRKMIRIK